jgi:sigma-B regulation protein RsbU (phosphoserine phosphatase)
MELKSLIRADMESPRILIADDQAHVRDALELLLKNEGFVSESVSSPAAVVEAVKSRNFDVVLLDLNYARDTTSGVEGLELLSRVRQLDSSLPVVLMTAWASIDLAVEAMQGGGRDFVQKPWDNDKLLNSLRRQIEEGRILREKKLEMQDARDIQRRLLPAERLQLSGCDIDFYWKPAKEVGGDYFDAIRLTGTSAAFCIADVAGKGLPAALLMSNMQASVRGLAPGTSSPAQMCARLNRVALDNTRSGRFTTFFYGVLDSERHTLRFSNAGHVPPFLIRHNGSVSRLSEGGMVLGVLGQAQYAETEIAFEAGDRLVLVTDGFTEASNAEYEEFGEQRLTQFLSENGCRPASELRESLLQEVASFAGQTLQDDATLMIVSMQPRCSDGL